MSPVEIGSNNIGISALKTTRTKAGTGGLVIVKCSLLTISGPTDGLGDPVGGIPGLAPKFCPLGSTGVTLETLSSVGQCTIKSTVAKQYKLPK